MLERNSAEICSTYEQTDCGSDCPQILRQRPITPGKLQSWLWKNNLLAHLFHSLTLSLPPWHCAKWQTNAAKTVARCRTFWATGQAHKCHMRRMLNVHCAQNFSEILKKKKMNCNSNGVNCSQSNFFPPMTCTIILSAWQCATETNNNNCGKNWT